VDGAGHAAQVIPVLGDQRGVDAVAGEPSQVRRDRLLQAPEAAVGDVGQPGGEPVAGQAAQAVDHVTEGAGVGGQPDGWDTGLVGVEAVKEELTVAEGPADDHPGEGGPLIGRPGVVGDAVALPPVAGVGAGGDAAHGNPEAHAVRRGHLAAAPVGDDGQRGVVVDQPSVGRRDGGGAYVVPGDPLETALSETGMVGAHDRHPAHVAGLGQQHGAHGQGGIYRTVSAPLRWVNSSLKPVQ
jgi:hypothetical protein